MLVCWELIVSFVNKNCLKTKPLPLYVCLSLSLYVCMSVCLYVSVCMSLSLPVRVFKNITLLCVTHYHIAVKHTTSQLISTIFVLYDLVHQLSNQVAWTGV